MVEIQFKEGKSVRPLVDYRHLCWKSIRTFVLFGLSPYMVSNIDRLLTFSLVLLRNLSFETNKINFWNKGLDYVSNQRQDSKLQDECH